MPVIRDPEDAATLESTRESKPPDRGSPSGLSKSPVKADPFVRHVVIPAGLDPKRTHGDLEMGDVAPEAAARIAISGQDAGGFMGRPCRLEVTRFLRVRTDLIRIEPFAPLSARLVIDGPERVLMEDR
jgi:hypothetical protein